SKPYPMFPEHQIPEMDSRPKSYPEQIQNRISGMLLVPIFQSGCYPLPNQLTPSRYLAQRVESDYQTGKTRSSRLPSIRHELVIWRIRHRDVARSQKILH